MVSASFLTSLACFDDGKNGHAYKSRTVALLQKAIPCQQLLFIIDNINLRKVYRVSEIICYDPGHQPFSILTNRSFDGVIYLDVMEHCPKEDLLWFGDEIIGYAKKFAYFTAACFDAEKQLPN